MDVLYYITYITMTLLIKFFVYYIVGMYTYSDMWCQKRQGNGD